MSELRTFIFKTQTLHLYRSFLRSIRGAPSEAQGELRSHVRREFEASRGQKDVYSFKYGLSEGRTQLKQLRDMLGMRT